MQDRAAIGYEELAEVDLDLLEGVPDAALKEHFLSLASRASTGQLRQVLEIPVHAPERDHAVLVEEYASRRAATAVKLRGLLRG